MFLQRYPETSFFAASVQASRQHFAFGRPEPLTWWCSAAVILQVGDNF
jgi:hypothetical protein